MPVETKVFQIDIHQPLKQQLLEAGGLLRAGQLVAFPTETVYGLGANGLSGSAVASIYVAKGRPQDNPLILHIAHQQQLKPLVKTISPVAEKLMNAFWPGPLTLVFPKNDIVPHEVTAGLDTVAVRMPSHPVAMALIEAAGVPVAAPSANISGKPSPTEAAHVLHDLQGKIAAVVAAGSATVGLESTVLDITGATPTILRPGSITQEMLTAVVGPVEIDPALAGETTATPKAPGMKYTHYAPDGQVILVNGQNLDKVAAKITELVETGLKQNKKVATMVSGEIMDTNPQLRQLPHKSFVLGSRSDLAAISQQVYQALRQCDSLAIDLIVVEAYPRTGIGMALMNRLDKAAGYEMIQV